MGYDMVSPNLPKNSDVYDKLNELGFRTSRQQKVYKDIQGAFEFIEHLNTVRQDFPFGTDGAVIKVNDRKVFQALGIVGKCPRAAIAFKYPAEEVATVIKDIVITIGRTGAATPVAVFDPVQLAGSVVKHASLHNADEIARLDARVGDTVIVYKAGDIIPQVNRVLTELRPSDSKPFDYEQALKEQYPELEFERPSGEVAYRVKGSNADQMLKRAIESYASKSALNIEGLGEKNVVALVDSGLVSSIADLYTLTPAQLMSLERFGEVSAHKLVDNIQATKNPPLARFITAIGIRHIGTQTALDLAAHFKTFEALSNATEKELTEMPGIGLTVAESILAWFADEDNLALMEKLKANGVEPEYQDNSNGKLTGLGFVVTGTLDSMGRDEAAERIRALGGEFHSSVVKSTSYLVAGRNTGKSKLEKAAKLGTKVIDEAEFLKILGE